MKVDFFKADHISTVIVWTLVFVLGAIAFRRGIFVSGLKESGGLFRDVIFRISGALLLAGFAQILIPTEVVSRWLGSDSGWWGILGGTALGVVAPGGPMVSFPILSVLMTKGASLAASFAFLTSWAVLGVFRILTWELPFFGAHTVLLRLAVSFWLPLAVGTLTKILQTRIFKT